MPVRLALPVQSVPSARTVLTFRPILPGKALTSAPALPPLPLLLLLLPLLPGRGFRGCCPGREGCPDGVLGLRVARVPGPGGTRVPARRFPYGDDDGRELRYQAGQFAERVGPRHELEHPSGRTAPGVPRAGAQGGHQAGVQKGGLPCPGGADQHDQTAGVPRGVELGEQGPRAPLPPEEPVGVLPAVGSQAPVGADPAEGRRSLGGGLLLHRGRPGAFTARVGQRPLPQALPLDQVVQTGGDRYGPCAPGLGYEDVQDGREGGELGRHVLGPPPVADPLGGDPHRTPSFVDALEPDDGLGHTFEGRVAGLPVQQCEAFCEGRACP